MPRRPALIAALAVLPVAGLLAPSLAGAQSETHQTSAGPVTVERMATGFDTPWAVAFLPSGDWLVTERDGYLLRVEQEDGTRKRIEGVPEVYASGQGGLLDVVLDPGFAGNRVLYLSYAEPVGSGRARTAVARAVLSEDGTRLDGLTVIFRMEPATSGGRHFGSRIVPDGAGNLWVTLGERGEAELSQDLGAHMGKVIRIRTDGGIPDGNPFAGSERPEIWSYGHRNPQGAALDGEGQLWTVEHGARGGDEINRPQAGRNHGWPVISYGRHYSGGKIGEGTARDGMEQPVWYWDPSIAPSGLAICTGCAFPAWEGDLFAGSLKFDYVSRLDREGDAISGEERLFGDAYGRIRDVRFGPDGALWFLSVGDGVLYRARPAG